MDIAPVNLTEVIAVTLGTLIFLVPIAGLTMRFAIKPVLEAVLLARSSANVPQGEIARLERRIVALEQQLAVPRLAAGGLGGSAVTARSAAMEQP